MANVYLLLDEIRNDPQNSQVRWGIVMDYFLDEATDAERQDLIAVVSKDDLLAGSSNRQSIHDLQANPGRYLRHTLVSMLLNDGRPDPCQLVGNLLIFRSMARSKGIRSAQVDAMLVEVAEMGTPRLREVLLTGKVDVGQFRELGIRHCDDLTLSCINDIPDETVRELFRDLRQATGNYPAWAALADFYHTLANSSQRDLIRDIVRKQKLYKIVGKVDPNLETGDPRRYIELSMLITSMCDGAPDWRDDIVLMARLERLAQQHDIDTTPIRDGVEAISAPGIRSVIQRRDA